MKSCCHCNETKPASEFSRSEWRITKRRPQRRACCSAYTSAWHRRNRERRRLTALALNRKIQADPERRSRRNAQRVEWRRKLKAAAFEALGNSCVCCGEREAAFLQIDHIANDGSAYRKRESGNDGRKTWGAVHQHRLYKAVIAGTIAGLQLLCANCNWGKARNHGACPHEAQRRQDALYIVG